MKISTHSVLMATAAVLSAGVLSISQTVAPPLPPRPAPSVHLVAYVQPLVPRPHLLAPAGRAALVGTPPPTAAPLAAPIAPNLANTIDNAYLAIEPWVQYGFEVAASVVAWIPYVGFASGFIMDGYFFGESIVASGVFNFTDWLRGNGGIAENLVDFGVDVGLAFVWLGLDALNTVIPLPPCQCYPPRPPLQGPFLAAANTLMAPEETQVAKAFGADETQQPDEDLSKKQNAGEAATAESGQGTTEQATTGVDTTGVDATVVDTTHVDATVVDTTHVDATVVDTTHVEATDTSTVPGDDHEAVDLSTSAHEDATAGSDGSTAGATQNSSGTVQAQAELHETGPAEPVDAATEGQPAGVSPATGTAGDHAAATQAGTQTTSTPSTSGTGTGTGSSDTGGSTAGK